MTNEWDQERTQILAANTAQGVYRHLRNLESNRARVLPRWIWELLQNARDVARGHDSLTAIVEFDGRHLTFRHDGRPFEREEITHLIYYGSTKLELDEALGQFGSGFLTTHLLSPTINVSSRLEDGRPFAFRLDRGGTTVADLQRRMDASWDAFKSSLSLPPERDARRTPTTFRYPIDERAAQVVAEGIDALARTGPYVAAFNPEFKCIRMRLPAGETVLELSNRVALAEHTAEVRVAFSERDGGTRWVRRYLLSELDGVAIAVPFSRTDSNAVLEPVADAPKLALGFPLIGTEAFSFPAVVHSSRFAPTEERDGVFLGQADNDANLANQAVLEEACQLLLATIAFAAKSGWANAWVLAHIPRIRAYSWLDADWLRHRLREQLVDPLHETAAVATAAGDVIAPAEAALPIANTAEAVDRLWTLAADVGSLRNILPRRPEAHGWREAVGSWADIRQCSPGSIEGTIEGRGLAQRAQEAGSLNAMQDLLAADADACEWLNALHGFLADDGAADLSRTLRIVPDQTGRFWKLSDLHRDRDIPDRLKDIAELVDWELRAELRDGRLPVLAEEAGAGDLGPDDVVRRLIQDLRERMDAQLDDPSKAASVRLFGWIVEHERWRFLHGYPAFSDEGERSALIRLDRHSADDAEQPLAPVRTWSDDLREYAALFPRRHTLAATFADEAGDPAVWAALEDRGFLRRNVLYSRTAVVADFLPDEPLPGDDEQSVEHTADEAVAVTEVAFLTKTDVGVQSRVRQSRALAKLFWSFLTQWLVLQDTQAFEAGEAACACGDVHRYFPAAWLVPVLRNKWVPLEGRRTDRATAHSLAGLIRDSDWPTDLLGGSNRVTALLSALRVSVPELIMALATRDDDERSALDRTLSNLLIAVRHDWNRLGHLAGDIQEDELLFDHLAERREQRRTVRENQRLGALVEKLVKQGLEGEGFTVRRTGVGSDFAIELTRANSTWLVEVKSTRDDGVRMSAVQARTAVKHGPAFLLCVVPLGSDPEDPGIEQVRQFARFVEGIGTRLADICAGLDDLEELRVSVTSGEADGVRLEVESGSPRVRIDSAIWTAGIALEELFSRLTADGNADRGIA